MNRIFFGIVAVVASFIVVDSLTCNTCSFGLRGFCIGASEETCTNSSDLCSTASATFPDLPSFSGFTSQGCRANDTCNTNTNSTLLGFRYVVQISCCSTDNCNNGATTTKMTFSAAIGAAILASVLGSML